MNLGLIDLDAIVADGPAGLDRLRLQRDRAYRAYLVLDMAITALEQHAEDQLTDARMNSRIAYNAEPVREPEQDAEAPAPATSSSQADPAPAPHEPDSTGALEDLPIAPPGPATAQVLKVYQQHPGEWLTLREISDACPGPTYTAIVSRVQQLVKSGHIEHNGKATSGARTRLRLSHGHEPVTDQAQHPAVSAIRPDATAAEVKAALERTTELEAQDDEDTELERPLSLRPAPEPQRVNGPLRRLSAVTDAKPSSLEIGDSGTLAGRILESLRYRPGTLAEVAKRLRSDDEAGLRDVALAIRGLMSAGDVTPDGYIGDSRRYRAAV